MNRIDYVAYKANKAPAAKATAPAANCLLAAPSQVETLALVKGQLVTSGPQEVMVTKVEETSVSVVTFKAETEATAAATIATVENCIVERETKV